MAAERETERGNYAAGEWLRKLRLDVDVSQERLAEACDVAVDTIRSYEAGRRTPSRETIERILRYLEIPEALIENHIRWFRGRPLPADWTPWDKWAVTTSAPHPTGPRALLRAHRTIITLTLVGLAIGLTSVFALLPRLASAPRSVETLVLLTPAPAATPPGSQKFVGMNCQQYVYSLGRQNAVVEVCAWINLDHDNHRLRGRATLKQLEGPRESLAIPVVNLKQQGQVVRSSSQKRVTFAQPSLESYTELLDCGQGSALVTEVVAVVTYPDGRQGTYTLASKAVDPRC